LSRSVGFAHIVRQEDGTSTGVWGGYTLRSAFQPIFAFRDSKLELAAFEGLIRPFRDGEGISPGQFFGLVPPGDRLHVETLSRTLHLLNAAACLPRHAAIFVNFDPSVFFERAIADNALREMRLVLHESGIDPSRVVCEVTEKKSASEDALRAFVDALKNHGFRIAVDDYGADESDMQRINELKPDIVKFDAHWITRLMESGPGFALLAAMVATFSAQGIVSLFEGIEEAWQLELAERAGVAMVQGYVVARPQIVPANFAEFGAGAGIAAVQAVPATPAVAAAAAIPRQAGRPARAFGRRACSV
jgi:EAL domain-containing protein (putative c-di-GMP-specific phosphodiesterase class I)